MFFYIIDPNLNKYSLRSIGSHSDSIVSCHSVPFNENSGCCLQVDNFCTAGLPFMHTFIQSRFMQKCFMNQLHFVQGIQLRLHVIIVKYNKNPHDLVQCYSYSTVTSLTI